MLSRLGMGAGLAVLLGYGGCAYFNAMYNAERLFREAERAAEVGDTFRAQAAYGQSIAKAANSFRRAPESRWADDALYIIGRAHFERGDYAAAQAALTDLLALSRNEAMLAGARAFLGAADVRLGNASEGLAHLEEALNSGALREHQTFAGLWRARALFALGADDAAWSDLEWAAAQPGRSGTEARIERVSAAVQRLDADRATRGFQDLLQDEAGAYWADSVGKLARVATTLWGPDTARTMLAPATDAAWSALARQRLELYRAELAAQTGDTARAVEEARAIAERGVATVAHPARLLVARWRLASATDFETVEEIRALLLPAVSNVEARGLVFSIRLLGPLLERAAQGQHLALFVAAEICRDEIGSPYLARQLFLSFAEVAGDSDWGPKALLAAAALDPTPAEDARIRALLAAHQDNVYVRAAAGEDPGQLYALTEERLGRILPVVRDQARSEAERRDLAVARAVALLDTLRAAALADSLRPFCTALLDSLRIEGERGDSIRAACLRADTLRVDSLIRPDTLVRDTTGRPPLRHDTMPAALGFDPIASLLRGRSDGQRDRP